MGQPRKRARLWPHTGLVLCGDELNKDEPVETADDTLTVYGVYSLSVFAEVGGLVLDTSASGDRPGRCREGLGEVPRRAGLGWSVPIRPGRRAARAAGVSATRAVRSDIEARPVDLGRAGDDEGLAVRHVAAHAEIEVRRGRRGVRNRHAPELAVRRI